MADSPRDPPVPTLGPEGHAEDTQVAGEGNGRGGARATIGRGSTFGRYVVLERLGTGGMGIVYTAFDPELDRKVALKLMRPSSSSHADAGARRIRLLREAQALAKLSHPNVVTVYDVGTLEGDVFIAMEFIAGTTLRAWMDRRERKPGDWRAVLDLFVAAGRGLAAAHRAGIVHRDFKPENVMIDGQGLVKVLDFGLARPARVSEDAAGSLEPESLGSASGRFGSRLTATGALVGTPYYMAPEQYGRGEIDERTDQFSFCVGLYEALYAERPFGGSTTAELSHAVTQGRLRQPPKRTSVPLRVRRALLRGLRTAPRERFPSIDALLDALTHDPFARVRRLAWGGLLLGAPLVVLGVEVARRDRGPSCDHAEAALADAWTPRQREAVRANLATREAEHDRVLTALDRYAQAWSLARHDACEATHVRHEQTLATLELRYACLDARRYRLEAVASLLAEGDADIRSRAVELAEGLAPTSDCADVETLRRASLLPDDPQLRQRTSELERRLVKLQTWAKGGQFQRAREQMDALVHEAETVDHRPLLGEVLVTKGRMQVFLGDADGAEPTLERALLIGEAEGHDALVFDALLSVASLLGSHRSEFKRAWAELRRAGAVAERMGNPTDRLAQISLASARLASAEGKHELSAEHFQAYLDHDRALDRGDSGGTISALSSRGAALARIDRLDEAEALISEALERGRKALGETHPEVGAALIQRARLASRRGDDERALADLEQARMVIGAAYGPEHSNIGAVLHSIAVVHAKASRFEEARKAFESALPLIAKNYGEDNVQYAIALEAAGGVFEPLGRPVEGIAHIERALAIRKRVFGETLPYVDTLILLADLQLAADLLGSAADAYHEADRITGTLVEDKETTSRRGDAAWGLGEIANRTGHGKEARRLFEQAIRFIEPHEPDSSRLARARFGLAQMRWDAGEHESALELARAAVTELGKEPYHWQHLETANQWLTEREHGP